MPSREIDRDALMAEDRLEQGYVIILPGIEGHSRWNRGIRKGLLDAGVPYAIEIHDWTRGPWWYFRNLRDRRRHREQAKIIADKIVAYRERHPTQPMYLIGHSGGGAITSFALAELPAGVTATGGIMMVPALSPRFDLTPALKQTERGLWCYSSYGDVIFVGIGTTIFGTCDGRYGPSAGMLGFRSSKPSNVDANGLPPLTQLSYRLQMAKHLNFSGHLSCVNPRFIREWIAPIVLAPVRPAAKQPS